MEKHHGLTTFKGNPMTLVGNLVEVGAVAPDFTGLQNNLAPLSLSELKGNVIIISSAPSIDTGVCAAQTRRFNDEASKLGEVKIIAISCDLPFAIGRFCAAEGIDAVTTLSDHYNTDFGVKYGFLIEELRLLNRGIVVIDKEGVIRYIERVKENIDHPDYEKALDAVKELI